MILSQTKILNIFSGSLEISSVIEVLSSYCNRYTYKYIPHRDLWLSRHYFEISNYSEKKCLTINIKHINNVGASKFRTGVKNDKEQVCYFNYNKKDRAFNRFLAIRKPTSTSEIIFFIATLIDKSKKFEDNYYKVSNELKEFDNEGLQPKQKIPEPSQADTRRPETYGSTGAERKRDCKKQRRISKKPRFISG